MEESSANVTARTIGIDLSQETSTYVVLGSGGELLGEGKFATTAEGIDSAFGEAPTSRMILEASGLTHWVARRLEGMGHEVIVANPRRLHLISKSARKTDRNDAHTLARIGRVDPGLLHPTWLRDEKCLAVRAALRARKQLVWSRTRLINLVRAECKVHGVRLAVCTSPAFAKRAACAIPEILQRSLVPILDTHDALTSQIRDRRHLHPAPIFTGLGAQTLWSKNREPRQSQRQSQGAGRRREEARRAVASTVADRGGLPAATCGGLTQTAARSLTTGQGLSRTRPVPGDCASLACASSTP